MQMKCPNCGETSRIREHDKFCHRCGCDLRIGVKRECGTISVIRTDQSSLLKIGEEIIPISDYKIASSSDGLTELAVKITGIANVFELSANLLEPKK